jgi:hypothetical protein
MGPSSCDPEYGGKLKPVGEARGVLAAAGNAPPLQPTKPWDLVRVIEQREALALTAGSSSK